MIWELHAVLVLLCSDHAVRCTSTQGRDPLQRFSQAKEKLAVAIQSQVKVLKYLKETKLENDGVLSSNRTEKWRGSVSDCLRRMENASLRVMVVGSVSHGKSSMVNALLGQSVLPSDPGPVSRVSVRVKGSDNSEPSVALRGKSLTFGTLRSIVDSALSADAQAKIKTDPGEVVTLFWPRRACPVLQNDVEIWDTAGLDYDEDVDASVLHHCRKADVIVVTVDSAAGLSLAVQKFIQDLGQLTAVIAFTKWDTYLDLVTNERAQLTEEAYRARALRVLRSICSDPQMCDHDENLVFFVDTVNYLRHKSMQSNEDALSPGVQGMAKLEGAVDHIATGNGIRTKLVNVWRSSMSTSTSMVLTLTPLCDDLVDRIQTIKDKIWGLHLEIQQLPNIQSEVMIIIDLYLNLLLSGYVEQLAEVLLTDQHQLKKELFEGIDKDLATREHLIRLNNLLRQQRFAEDLSEEITKSFNDVLNLLPVDAREPCAVLLRHANTTFQLVPADCGLADFQPLTISALVYASLRVVFTLLVGYLLSFMPPMRRIRGLATALALLYAILVVLNFDPEYEQVKQLVSHLDHSLQRNSHRRLLAMVEQHRVQLHAEVKNQLAAVALNSNKVVDEKQLNLMSLSNLSHECSTVLTEMQLHTDRLQLLLPLLG